MSQVQTHFLSSPMLKWIISKVFRSIFLLIGSSFMIYSVVRLAPGSVVDMALGSDATDEMRLQLAKELGLDSGIIQGYFYWFLEAIQGNLGKSIKFMPGYEVADIALPAFLVTLSLASLALLFSILIAVVLSFLLGKPRNTEALFLGPLSLLNAVPSFVLSICFAKVVNYLIFIQLAQGDRMPPNWYPIPTYQPFGEAYMPFLFAALMIALGDGLFTDLLNSIRAEILQLMSSQFMNAVRAKGAEIRPHLIKNLIIPILSIFSARLPLVLSAVVIVEYIFTLDGSGYLLLEAAKNRDVPIVVGVSVFFTFAVILLNLILDLVKALIDPRQSAQGEGA